MENNSVEITYERFLPVNSKQFNSLVRELMDIYGFTNKNHVKAVVASRIAHSPVEVGTTTLRQLGEAVIRNLAFQVAQAQSNKVNEANNVSQLKQMILANPADQQALDMLQKMVDSGSKLAKELQAELTGSNLETGANIEVTQIGN